ASIAGSPASRNASALEKPRVGSICRTPALASVWRPANSSRLRMPRSTATPRRAPFGVTTVHSFILLPSLPGRAEEPDPGRGLRLQELQQHLRDLVAALGRGVRPVGAEVLRNPGQAVRPRLRAVRPQVRPPREPRSQDRPMPRDEVQLPVLSDLVLD